jgi:hypothetical protein
MAEKESWYMTADDFFKNAKPNTIAQDVRRDVARENIESRPTSEVYRTAGINGESWSHLASKVFGAEGE